MNKEIDYSLDDEGQDEDEDQLRQLMLRKVNQVVMPSAFKRSEVFLGRSGALLEKGSKEENGGVPRSVDIQRYKQPSRSDATLL